MSYVNYMSYVSHMSYVNYMSCVSYMSYLSYMSIFMNRLKSLEITRICFKYNFFSFQTFFKKFS